MQPARIKEEEQQQKGINIAGTQFVSNREVARHVCTVGVQPVCAHLCFHLSIRLPVRRDNDF